MVACRTGLAGDADEATWAVVANTTSDNRGSCALLRAAGFTLTESPGPDGHIEAGMALIP